MSKRPNIKEITRMARFGLNHTRNTIAEPLYFKFGIDFTWPINISAIITEKCNSKCRYCNYWRIEKSSEEMPIEQWKRALLSVRELIGPYAININGGEPFLKKGIIELLQFLNRKKIGAGITTNASTLTTKEAADRFVSARPICLNISCESVDPKIHDYIRGWKGLHRKLTKAIKLVLSSQKEQQIQFPIIMKSTINALNLRQLSDLVRWSEELGVTAIEFQPIGIWTQEVMEEMYIREGDYALLAEVIGELISLKADGAPIRNSEEVLRLVLPYFKGVVRQDNRMPCSVGLSSYRICANGDVLFCTQFPSIGNVSENSAREIWRGRKAREIRQKTVNCKRLCLLACYTKRSVFEKAKFWLKSLAA